MTWMTLLSGAAVAALINWLGNWVTERRRYNREVESIQDSLNTAHYTWKRDEILKAGIEFNTTVTTVLPFMRVVSYALSSTDLEELEKLDLEGVGEKLGSLEASAIKLILLCPTESNMKSACQEAMNEGAAIMRKIHTRANEGLDYPFDEFEVDAKDFLKASNAVLNRVKKLIDTPPSTNLTKVSGLFSRSK